MNDIPAREFAFAETKRHKPCLIYLGHRYVQDKIQNRTIYWRCEDRSHCNGRAHQLIDNESLPILTIQHNHLPIVKDLLRHDIVSVDSHRRRRRQNQKVFCPYSNEQNDLLTPSIMTSTIKLEDNQGKHARLQQQYPPMVKNHHLSEVITTTTAPHTHPTANMSRARHSTVDPSEMTKLLSNITTVSRKSPLKPSSTMDGPSRLNHFSWEELEGRYFPVIYRNENGTSQRYTSKIYVENTLFQSDTWQRHLITARTFPPLVSYSYTEHELKLFRTIVSWHLAGVYFKTVPSSDCLIRFEDLWELYNTLRKLRDTTSLNRPIAPLPPKPTIPPPELPSTQVMPSFKQSSVEKTLKESGWVQINNVFVPYIIKVKLRENELTKDQTHQSQREFYVPYEILIKCHIFSDTEFSFKKFLIKATQEDFDILNNLITDINIFDEKVPEKTLLVNLYHVMVGLNRILYIKFLPTKQPRTQVNKYHSEVLIHKGGTLLMNGNKLIPYIVQNSRFYVPLLYTFHSLPTILLQAKRGARAPRQYEIDYLNLLFIYFSIDIPPLTSDTLLVDIFNIRSSDLQTPIHFRTLLEHQQYEKTKLCNAVVQSTSTLKSLTGSLSPNKTSRCPPTNVVVNPMIHHPSFYSMATTKPVSSSMKQSGMKKISIEHHPLNAIVKSSDLSHNNWKISIKEIFEQFSFEIDYQRFIQWSQTNFLLPLSKLDEDERKIVPNNHEDDYYVEQRHLNQCITLLKDLQQDTTSMTSLSASNYESQLLSIRSPLAGAKKRKKTLPTTTRHIPPVSVVNERNLFSMSTSPEHPFPEEPTLSNPTDMLHESLNDQVDCSIVADIDDDQMPVVASVEEEQPIEGSTQAELDTTFVIAESADYNDERIQLDDAMPSCSSGYESLAVLYPIHEEGEEDESHSTIRFREHSSSSSSTVSPSSPKIPSINQKKVTRKRPRNGYGRSRSRARSAAARAAKKRCLIDDHDDHHQDTSLIVIITSEKIEQHLRTLFLAPNETRRTRTRPVKTPTRLVEELNPNNNTVKILEPASNVFDILSSSATTDPRSSDELTENSSQSCTYNVVISSRTDKLGLTIKKVVPS